MGGGLDSIELGLQVADLVLQAAELAVVRRRLSELLLRRQQVLNWLEGLAALTVHSVVFLVVVVFFAAVGGGGCAQVWLQTRLRQRHSPGLIKLTSTHGRVVFVLGGRCLLCGVAAAVAPVGLEVLVLAVGRSG